MLRKTLCPAPRAGPPSPLGAHAAPTANVRVRPDGPSVALPSNLNETGTRMQEIHAQTGTATTVASPAVPTHPLLPWLEFVAGCLGFNGIGLLFAGKRVRGVLWFVFSLLRHAISIPLLGITLGAAIACIAPLNIAIGAYLGLSVARVQRRAQHAAAMTMAAPTSL